ncbi:hypothetical protein QUF80_15890 [Desulfococcaceae bacterium HSG8]|nr:hypothetical protein [Desulfococcaceae bacterium HSG8]
MKVFNLIYTKVSPDETPWRKTGFHTVFYPTALMSKEDIFEIEKKIHFSGAENFREKETVFFQSLQGQYHLIILHIRSLPEARDTFGRSGIFLCHGFIFPPESWRCATTPRFLFEQVKHTLFTSREEILSSPMVNRETGDIGPSEISGDSSDPDIPLLNTEFERKMAMLFNRLGNMKEKVPVVLFKGTPDRISAIINNTIAYVPDDLKISLGWDPAFETGNLAFYPLNILGFSHDRPMGGVNVMEINAETLSIPETAETAEFFLPRTPYEYWLSECPGEADSAEHIEKAFNLSLLLDADTHFARDELLTERSGFAVANQSRIKAVFFEKCQEILGEPITRYLENALTPESMLNMLIENFPFEILAREVEMLIFECNLTPKTVRIQKTDSLAASGSKRLGLIERIWNGEILKSGDVESLERGERTDLMRYLLCTEWSEADWTAELLRKDEKIFNNLLSSHDTGYAIKKILFGIIMKEKKFAKIREIILDEMLNQFKGFGVLREETGLTEILENLFIQGFPDERKMKKLTSWAKKTEPPADNFPYIKAFLFPRQGIPEIILENKSDRQRLVTCLIEYHKYKLRDFKSLGSDKYELLKIKELLKRNTVGGKIKRFLKRA